MAWELLVGPIPGNHILDHLKEVCGNRACCNPAHLEPVTSAVNTQRKRTAKLDWAKVTDIRARAALGEDLNLLAEQYRVTRTNIVSVVQLRTWKPVDNSTGESPAEARKELPVGA